MARTEQRNITLTTILHDPENRQVGPAKKYWPILAQLYPHLCVCATPKVSDELINFLRKNGTVVEQTNRGVGDGRRRAVEMAHEQGTEYIHLSDFDRILHWICTYPQELPAMASSLLHHDFMILGRTQRAFETHPKVQQVAESITNKAFALACKSFADVTSGSCAMNRRAAQVICRHSIGQVNDTDTEWPLLVLERRMTLGYGVFEGLEFETPDYYAPEIHQAGGIEPWLERTYNTPKMWAQRMELAEQSINRVIEYEQRTGAAV